MKKIFTLLIATLLLINLFNCTEKDDIAIEQQAQNFVWKAMNLYYLWQEEVPDLQDDRFNTQNELNNFLEGKSPETVFEDLFFEDDRFSFMTDNFIELENLLAGITLNNGMEFGLVAIADDVEQIFGFVRYIIPNSDAETKGVERGQIIYGINGTELTRSNFKQLLANDTYTIDFGNYILNNNIPQITTNGQHITLTKAVLTENPVHTVTINEIDGHKIGYLFYNQFVNEFDNELNNAFLELKNENITDLVLDLRYNGGGSVNTAILLTSMITGQFTGQNVTTLSYNGKLNSQFGISTGVFQNNLINGESINHLNLDEITILVTGNTASASELIINSLKPYINVNLIGTQTVGKFVGSVTLYDSDNYGRTDANPNHTYAIQPIVSELVNSVGSNNNHIGFIPNIILPENYANLGIIGNVNEPLFAEAINEITSNRMATPKVIKLSNISNSKKHFAQNNMFVELK